MATCSPQSLLSDSACLAALASSGQLDWVEVQILCNLKSFLETGGEVTCDVQELLDDASCFAALPAGLLAVAKVQLLCDIAALISGGSAAGFLSGSGPPEGVVIGLISGQTYKDLDAPALYSFGGTVGTAIGWS